MLMIGLAGLTFKAPVLVEQAAVASVSDFRFEDFAPANREPAVEEARKKLISQFPPGSSTKEFVDFLEKKGAKLEGILESNILVYR